MNNNRLYKIGEISKICNIPIRTLHHYDKIGLLKPTQVDPINNYRLYSHKQLLEISVIKYFKIANFSLKEIKELLKRSDIDYIKEMINSKCTEIESEIFKLTALKNKLQTYLNKMDKKRTDESSLNIVLKEIPTSYVAYSRYTGECNVNEFYLRFTKLNNLIEKHNLIITGTMMAIYYDDYRSFDYSNADIEVCVKVGYNKPLEGVTREFGGFLAAVSYHYGSYANMSETYGSMLSWLNKNGYCYVGGAIENYIVDSITTSLEDEYITELILPVVKQQ